MATQYIQYPVVTVAAAPEQFTRDGGTQTVTEDTVVPANNRPLPTKLTGPLGDNHSTLVGGNPTLDVNLTQAVSLNENLHDGAGNAVTSQVSGGQRALDVGVNVAGVQVDPRAIRALTNADVVKAQLQDNAGTAIVLGQGLMAASVPVVIASNQTNFPVKIQDSAGSAITNGQQTMANSVPVVLASNQTAIAVTTAGLTQQPPFIRNDYTGTSVTTAAYVQLVAALGSNVKKITLFDSSGQTLLLALGGAGVEVDQLVIPPGGHDGQIDFVATAGQRLSIKAISADATVGEIDINLYN